MHCKPTHVHGLLVNLTVNVRAHNRQPAEHAGKQDGSRRYMCSDYKLHSLKCARANGRRMPAFGFFTNFSLNGLLWCEP